MAKKKPSRRVPSVEKVRELQGLLRRVLEFDGRPETKGTCPKCGEIVLVGEGFNFCHMCSTKLRRKKR